MLIAAMVLGLIGGITYFVGGGAGAIGWQSGDSAPWWVISLVPIGVLGAMGAAIARTKPMTAGVVMLLAAVAALGIGFASYEEYAADYIALECVPATLPTHAFAGSLVYFPVPLLTLIIGGVLALASGKKSAAED
ncbi:MAG: hypothetical protein QUS33_06700 [Dehalococcoidia bacterium]|nr:hypothetical protein [Dehalococcoidia bacterium]